MCIRDSFKGSIQTQPLHIYGKYHLKLKSGDKYIILIDICDIDDENKEKMCIRDRYMAAIEEIGISFDEFIDISLEAMREIGL